MLYVNNKLKLSECFNEIEYDEFPIDRRMSILNEKNVYGYNSENIRFTINEVVRLFAKDGIYFEVGTYLGASLISASLFNGTTKCIGLDIHKNGYECSSDRHYATMMDNFLKFDSKNIHFIHSDIKDVNEEMMLNALGTKKIDVYFYDGEHKEEAQYNGLIKMLPYLNEKCIIMIDDINWDYVERPAENFIIEHGFEILFKVKKTEYPSNWWNGFLIAGRGI
jgi:protein O-GlcNAc transferase